MGGRRALKSVSAAEYVVVVAVVVIGCFYVDVERGGRFYWASVVQEPRALLPGCTT